MVMAAEQKYHFGSKQGLVAAAGGELGEEITAAVLESIGGRRTLEDVARGVLDGVWTVMDRDERLARLYFDLTVVSVVEDEVRAVMREIKSRWREVVLGLLRDAEPRVPPRRRRALAVLISSGVEGLALERIEGGQTPELRQAQELFVKAVAAVG